MKARIGAILLTLGLLIGTAPFAAYLLEGYFSELVLSVPFPIVACLGVLLSLGGLLFPKKRWLVASLGIQAAVWAALLYDGSRYDPKADDRLPLRVMTYNVMWAQKAGVNAVAEAVLKEAPDVVCFQEVSPHPPPHPEPKGLQLALPGYRFHWYGEMMIASRLPVLAKGQTYLPGNFDSRPLLWMDVRAGPRSVRVMAVHLIYSTANGFGYSGLTRTAAVCESQMRAILAEVQKSPHPVVLAGDFNIVRWQSAFSILSQSLRDTSRGFDRRLQRTIPSQLPLRKIDFIMASPQIESYRTWVPDANASDHEPLVADLGLTFAKEPRQIPTGEPAR